MKYIQIRKATIRDLQIIQHIASETFFETYIDSNTQEDIDKYIGKSFNYKRVSDELNNQDSVFFIALEDENPIGYLKLNTGAAQTEKQGENALEIERIYVKRSHHGKKTGQLLFEKALTVALRQHSSYLWLGVWEKNPRAIRFYEKNGFTVFDKRIFRMGDDEQADFMMKKELH